MQPCSHSAPFSAGPGRTRISLVAGGPVPFLRGARPSSLQVAERSVLAPGVATDLDSRTPISKRPADARPAWARSALARVLVATAPLLFGCQASDEHAAAGATLDTGSTPASGQERLPPPGRAWVIFGGDTVHAEVARTPEERAQGLMNRDTLPAGRGMLFVFPDVQTRSFWMKNTFIPLDIAYLDEELRIIDIQSMEPETLDPHASAGPALMALEVPKGWFAAMGIEVGDQATIVFGPGMGAPTG